MAATVVIVGRPNVGKSTLFNRLTRRRQALVDNTPGVTRDWREGEAHLGALSFTVIDTAGLDDATGDGLEARIRAQTEIAIGRADLVLMMIDGRAGVTPLDRHFSDLVRRAGAPVVIVVNKAEGHAADGGLSEAHALGLGEPVAISAEHAEGMSDLHDSISLALGAGAESADGERQGPALRLTIVGRPNTGKSTLLNRLVGDQRVLTGPEPGVTRDAIAVDWSHDGRPVRLVDTAGMRRRARITDKVEKLSVADALRAVRFAHVAVLVVDASAPVPAGTDGPLDKQDLNVANLVIDEGRALVVAANKWDLVADPAHARRALSDQIEAALPQVRGLSFVTLSALRGDGVDAMMRAVFAADEIWNKRLATAALNRWLEDTVARHPPPLAQGRHVKLRYMAQVSARPPRFALFVNRPRALSDSYQRYLVNGLRETFDLPGVPIRLLLRAGHNPYVKAPGGKAPRGKAPRRR
jgi:GTP-binding protein